MVSLSKFVHTLFLFSLFVFSFRVVNGEMIASTRFENASVGQAFTRDKWNSEGFTTGPWDEGLASRTQIDSSSAVSGEKSLRVFYPKGKYGTANTGSQVELTFEPRREAYMSYWMRFSPDFSFGTTSEGGKLPGLCGGDDCSGGNSCDGTNGFSARFMWRAGGSIVLYLYHMDKPAKYGEDHDLRYPDGTSVVFERGKWYHIEERVRCNSAANVYDGQVEAWVNGVHVLLVDSLRFTSNGDMVDKLYISTFHGGDDDTWAPTNDSYIWFDDIRIGTSREDTRFQTCIPPSLGPNRSICAEKTISLSVPELTDESYTWYRDGVVVSHDSEIGISTTGEYVLKVDSSWCSTSDTLLVYDNINTTISDDYYVCNTPYQTISANLPDDGGYLFQWTKNGKVISDQSTVSLKNEGEYQLMVSAPGCEDYKKNFVVSSGLLNITDTVGVANQTVTLSTPDKMVCEWFDSEDAKTPLFVGEEYNTIIPQGTKTYFVKDANAFSGYVGKKYMYVDKSYTDNRFERKMVFEVYKSLTIDSISIYPAGPLDAVIRILTADGKTVVWEQKYEGLSQGEKRLPIGAKLEPGKYMMDAEGSTGSLRHSNEKDTETAFPYLVDGVIAIKGSNVSWIDNKPYYLFFFNWKVSSGNVCARTPVEITGVKPNYSVNEQNETPVSVSVVGNSLRVTSKEPVLYYKLFSINGVQLCSGKPKDEKQFEVPLDLHDGLVHVIQLFFTKGSFVTKF